MDRQGEFLERPSADAQGHERRRSRRPGAERHDRKAQGNSWCGAGGDALDRHCKACAPPSLSSAIAAAKKKGRHGPARKSLNLTLTPTALRTLNCTERARSNLELRGAGG